MSQRREHTGSLPVSWCRRWVQATATLQPQQTSSTEPQSPHHKLHTTTNTNPHQHIHNPRTTITAPQPPPYNQHQSSSAQPQSPHHNHHTTTTPIIMNIITITPSQPIHNNKPQQPPTHPQQKHSNHHKSKISLTQTHIKHKIKTVNNQIQLYITIIYHILHYQPLNLSPIRTL